MSEALTGQASKATALLSDVTLDVGVGGVRGGGGGGDAVFRYSGVTARIVFADKSLGLESEACARSKRGRGRKREGRLFALFSNSQVSVI